MSNHEHTPFGADTFGRAAERFARFFGTPQFIVGQTLVVAVWIAGNAYLLSRPFDPFPFILLNLAFSTQAAYAAPLILLAQTRQADRDKRRAQADAQRAQLDAEHREQIAAEHMRMLTANTDLTREVHRLAAETHRLVTSRDAGPSGAANL